MNVKKSILVFSDAGKNCDNGRLCYIAEILFDTFEKDSFFHTLSWSSYEAKRPDRSIGAAETLAAGEAIDEGNVLENTLSSITYKQVDLVEALDRKDLFSSLSTQGNSIEKIYSCRCKRHW